MEQIYFPLFPPEPHLLSSCSPKPTCDSHLLTFCPAIFNLLRDNDDDALERVSRKSIGFPPNIPRLLVEKFVRKKSHLGSIGFPPPCLCSRLLSGRDPGLCQQPLGQGHLSTVTSHFSNLSNHFSFHLREIQFSLTCFSSVLLENVKSLQVHQIYHLGDI